MNKEEEYLSDSDQSDEDFCPDKANISDAPSEEESDDPISENEDESVKKKKSKSRTKASNKPKKSTKEPVVEEHVVATRNRTETSTKSSIEKDELESDEEDPSRKDALWADFLSDVGPPAPSKPNRAESSSKSENKPALNKKPSPAADKKPEPAKEPEKVVVTEIFEFAGEEVRVEKSVDADSLKENGSKMVPASSGSDTARGPSKRPAGGGGGLGSILSNIGKKKKISVLEKTKIDWDTFKSTEGISEELQTFNKGKDGYLQRQDFLERTDLRQFEIEKSIRQARRKPM